MAMRATLRQRRPVAGCWQAIWGADARYDILALPASEHVQVFVQ